MSIYYIYILNIYIYSYIYTPKCLYVCEVSHRDELSDSQRLKPFQLAVINLDLLGFYQFVAQ